MVIRKIDQFCQLVLGKREKKSRAKSCCDSEALINVRASTQICDEKLPLPPPSRRPSTWSRIQCHPISVLVTSSHKSCLNRHKFTARLKDMAPPLLVIASRGQSNSVSLKTSQLPLTRGICYSKLRLTLVNGAASDKIG